MTDILSRVSYSSLNTGLDSQAYIQGKVDTHLWVWGKAPFRRAMPQ